MQWDVGYRRGREGCLRGPGAGRWSGAAERCAPGRLVPGWGVLRLHGVELPLQPHATRARGRRPYRTRTTMRVRGPCTPSTRSSSMSLVAEGPLIMVRGAEGSRRARPSGTDPTTWGASTTQSSTSGSSDSARRPHRGEPSRTRVPVSPIATETPVTVAAYPASATAGRPSSSVAPAGRRSAGRPGATTTSGGQSGGDDDVGRVVGTEGLVQRLGDRDGDVGAVAPDHRGAVVLEPIGEHVEQRGRAGLAAVGGPVTTDDVCRLGAVGPERRPDPAQHLLAGGHGRCSRTQAWVNVSCGGLGRSRLRVHAEAGGGRGGGRGGPPGGEEPAETGSTLGQPPQPGARHGLPQRPEGRSLGGGALL